MKRMASSTLGREMAMTVMRSLVLLCASFALLGAGAPALAAEQAAPPVAPAPTATPVAAPTPAPAPAAAAAKKAPEPLKVSGYVQLDYRRGDTQGVTTVAPHELVVRRARLSFAGNVSEAVSYAVTLRSDGLVSSSTDVIDASIDVRLVSGLRVRGGQYKYEFDLEGRESDSGNPLPDRPFPTNAVAGGLGGASGASSPSSSFRDRGVSLLGETKALGVAWSGALGLFQGAGRAPDENGSFAVVANLKASPREWLTLNAGFLRSPTQKAGSAEAAYSAWTAGVQLQRGKLFLRSEYYRGERDAAETQELQGFYVTGAYSLAQRFDLLLRYQTLRDGRFPAGSDSLRGADVTLKRFLVQKGRHAGTHLSATYGWRDADEGFAKGVTLLNDGRGPELDSGARVAPFVMLRMQVQF